MPDSDAYQIRVHKVVLSSQQDQRQTDLLSPALRYFIQNCEGRLPGNFGIRTYCVYALPQFVRPEIIFSFGLPVTAR